MNRKTIVEDTRAMLRLFAAGSWRDLHVRCGGYEMFLAKPGGATNPMNDRTLPSAPGIVNAPHLGLFFASLAAGAAVEADTVVGELEVLGEREDIVAGRAGHVVALLVADGALVEYATPLVRIAA